MTNGTLLRLIIAVAKLAKIKPSQLAKLMRHDRTKPYAVELHYELGKKD